MSNDDGTLEAPVRCRTLADLPATLAALRDVQAHDGYPSRWPEDAAAWLTPDGFLDAWIAIDRLRVVGHVALGRVDARADPQLAISAARPPHALAEVKRLFVVPAARWTGVARRLLDAAVARARAQGLHPVLEVAADRAGPVRFYERNGWRRIGSHVAGWQRAGGERPLLYQYELPP